MQSEAIQPVADDGVRRAERQLGLIRNLLYAVAGVAAVGGVLAGFFHFDALARLGFSRATILVGALFAVLAYYAGQRSRVALALALAVLLLDTALLAYSSGGHLSGPIAAALVARVLLAILIARGFGAMRRLDDTREAMTRRLLNAFSTARSLASATTVAETARAERTDGEVNPVSAELGVGTDTLPLPAADVPIATTSAEQLTGIVTRNAVVVCPKCGHHQHDVDACFSCGLAFERYRSASLRATELETRLGRTRN